VDGIGSGLCLAKECGISDVAPSNFSMRKLLDKRSKLDFICVILISPLSE